MSSPITLGRRFAVRKQSARNLGLKIILPLLIATLPFVPALTRVIARSSRTNRTSKNRGLSLAKLSDSISVHAAGQGAPGVNLSDGRQVQTAYAGPEELQQALAQNQAQPLSLATADFDEDGVPDLVSGFGYQGRGIVSLLRGNVDALYPNAPEAQQRKVDGHFSDAPFLSPARLFATPAAADFIGAGDFDGDSHWDVVTGSRDHSELFLLAGNGRGEFTAPQLIPLPGPLTALTTGEINRADGLTDLVIGVSAKDASQVLMFEGPNGALRSKPEVLTMPAPVAALALGQFDHSYQMDLAVAAGEQLLVLHGRDRKLSLDDEQQAGVRKAKIESINLGTHISELATGSFLAAGGSALAISTGNVIGILAPDASRPDSPLSHWVWRKSGSSGFDTAQLISANISSFQSDDLVVVDPSTSQLRIFNSRINGQATTLATASTPKAILAMRLNPDALTDLVVLQEGQSAPSFVPTTAAATFVVNSNADTDDGVCNAANCTLREAINAANASGGADTINFNIAPAGAKTILLTNALPIVSEAVTIDATTQPGFAGAPIIEISGQNSGSTAPCFFLRNSSSVTVRGFVINRYRSDSISVNNGFNHVIEGNYIGLDLAGTSIPNPRINGGPITVIGPSGNILIGGTTTSARNILTGPSQAVVTSNGASGLLVRGNYVGTDVTGTTRFIESGNYVPGGFFLSGGITNTVVGGTAAGSRNVFGGNGIAIWINDFFSGVNSGNLIQNNYLGTTADGLSSLGNNSAIIIEGASNNTVGGTTAAAQNILAATAQQTMVVKKATSTGNLIQGNYIGLNAAGAALANHFNNNVFIQNGASDNTVGGAAAGARNVISNCDDCHGVVLGGAGTNNNRVQGNYIGTNATGTAAMGNGRTGIFIYEGVTNTLVGGTTSGTGNLISSNSDEGIAITGLAPNISTDNVVQGNLIGTNASGTAALPNTGGGIAIANANRNIIGGNTAAARNVISGNSLRGVFIYGGAVANSAGPFGAADNQILGNFIGTTVNGNAALPNQGDGVQVTISAGSPTNTIGGDSTSARNIISGNTGHGVSIGITLVSTDPERQYLGTGATGITVQNNYIGTDVTGQNCVGNTLDGVFVDADSTTNTISDNLIACNGRNGVFIPQNSNPGVRILIDGNDIYANASLGIDLGNPGITPNDPQDTDGGANLQQNFPTLTSYALSRPNPAEGETNRPLRSDSTITVNGTMNSTPNRSFTVHWSFSAGAQCVNNQPPSHFLDGGRIPNLVSNSNGDLNFSFALTFPPGVTSGVIATNAIDESAGGSGNTSEFGPCLPVNSTPSPSLSINDVSHNEGNSGTTGYTFTVSLSASSNQTVTVNYATANGTATTADSDYSSSSGTLTFNPGETSKQITVSANGDAKFEPDENFFVNLSSPTNATISDAQGQGTITNDDSQPTLSINDISQSEGNSGTSSFTFTVTLSNPSSQIVSANFATANGTASSSSDYQSASGAVSFNPGETSKQIAVTVNGDTTFEADETFTVNLSAPSQATIADSQGVGTILNDDAAPTTMQFSLSGYPVNEGGVSATITVTRTGGLAGASTVDFAASDGSATQNQDYVVTSGTLSFAANETSKTFDVLIVNDAYIETAETINLTLSNATGGTLGSPGTATITITDNDSAGSTSPGAKRYSAFLEGAQETPASNSQGKGAGYLLLNANETAASVSLQFQGLGSAETAAHIHGPGAVGVSAPILFTLPTTNPVANFQISPTAQQVADLKAGLLYLNVHSTNFTNGEIRGQLRWNPTLEENFFVRQQYLDFLSRDGDPGGFGFWVNQVGSCGADAQCLHDRTITTSNAFFFEPEFQQTAGYVFRAYRAAFGNNQPFPNPDSSNAAEANKLIDYAAFVADRARVVGGANLAQAQQDFANQFVMRSAFTTKYAAATSAAQFVDAMLANIQSADGANLTAQRQVLIDQYNNAGGGNAGRATVLYRLADDNAQSPLNNQAFINAEYNRQFALTLFFGYLRRNPDIGGFLFWQGQINLAAVRDVPKQNALVCSFITAAEYQLRFGPNAPRSNAECPQ